MRGRSREPGAPSVPETRGKPFLSEIPLYLILARDEDFFSCPFLSFPHHFLCDVMSFHVVAVPPPVVLFFKRKKKLYFE